MLNTSSYCTGTCTVPTYMCMWEEERGRGQLCYRYMYVHWEREGGRKGEREKVCVCGCGCVCGFIHNTTEIGGDPEISYSGYFPGGKIFMSSDFLVALFYP